MLRKGWRACGTEPPRMDQSKLRAEKLEPRLRTMLAEPGDNLEAIPVIVQTFGGLTPQVLDMLKTWGGTVKDELKLIKGFSSDLSPRAIETLILSDQIKAISYDAPVYGTGG